jgi:phospholipid/cholesterol/gamma-HCH transport system substrate-binding protein
VKSGKINYVVVGAFVLAMLVGLVVTLALVTGRTGATDGYHAAFRNVAGIKFGTRVLFEGYPIGQVVKITPEPVDGKVRFRVDFSVAQGWRIPKDSTAEIAASGLLAAVTLNIGAGSSAEALSPGSQVRARDSANIFAVMSSAAADVGELAQSTIKPLLVTLNELAAADIRPLLASLNELASKDLKPLLATMNRTAESFGTLIETDAPTVINDAAVLVRQLNERVPRIASTVEEVAAKLDRAADQLGALLTPDNRKTMEAAIARLDKSAASLDKLLASLNTLVADNRAGVEKVIDDLRHVTGTVARDIDSVNQNLEGAARNMYEFSRQIRQNPGLLLGGTPPKDAAQR